MATFKPVYAASASVTITLTSLASDTNRLAGRQSSVVDNSTNLYDDVLLSGSVKMGTSPTAGNQVDIWIVAVMDGGTTYPDVITSAGDANKTWTSANIRNAAAKLIKTIIVDSTTGGVFAFSNESVASLFGGNLPQKFVVFVSNGSGATLDASAGGSVNVLGVQYQSV